MMMMMQGAAGEPKNKEQFKLLQFSDSKSSLSDLELHDVVVPRKRKVRRKTKPKNGHRHRKHSSGDGAQGSCKNIGLWVAVASNVGWLLILSYIVSMVHSEYANLERAQTKLAGTIKTLPDEWHDKSHSLEVNQSTFFHQLFELQQTVKNLTDDYLQLRTAVQQQQAQASDWGRVGLLEKSLADFGASLKSVNSEIDTLKNRSLKATETLAEHTQAIDYFRDVVVRRKLNETTANGEEEEANGRDSRKAIEETLKLRSEIEEVRNTTQSFSARLDKFTTFATNEEQRVEELEKSYTDKINYLSDSVANITAQDVNQAMKNYQEQMKVIGNRLASLEKHSELEALRSQLEGMSLQVQKLQEIREGSVVQGTVATTTTGGAVDKEKSAVTKSESGSPPIM